MATRIHIYKKHADTRRIIFHIVSKDSPTGINLSGWTNFSLIIDPNEFPPDNSTNVATISGTIVDTANGRVSFVPTGTVPAGNYYYNARAIDNNGERFTFAQGKFNISQDI